MTHPRICEHEEKEITKIIMDCTLFDVNELGQTIISYLNEEPCTRCAKKKQSMLNMEVICKKCNSKNVQSTLSDWDGYSEYTVLESSNIEFKCKDCGKFGSSAEYKKPNDFDNFIVQCYCGAEDDYELFDTLDEDVEEVHIKCNKCGRKDK